MSADSPPTDPSASGPGLRRSPLEGRHTEAGATFTEFGGWRMPVRYTSDLAEHEAVRTTAGLFDISHMAEFLVDGRSAGAFLDYALAGVLSTLPTGRAKYSLLLAEDGGILDDLIVYATRDDRYLVVANAANRRVVREALRRRATAYSAAVTDVTDEIAMIAVQGPMALPIVESVIGLVADASEQGMPGAIASLRYYSAVAAGFRGEPALIARTGYTGEDGFEIFLPVDAAAALWDAVLEAGAPFGVRRCGLACRDTLRLEAGMPLYGHELTRETLPDQAGLGRVVAPAGSVYVGAEAVEAARRRPAGRRRVLTGLRGAGRRAARAGYPVLGPVTEEGTRRDVGVVTSGALSPTLGVPIALVSLDQDHASPGTQLVVDVRGTELPMTVVRPPFYRRTGSPS